MQFSGLGAAAYTRVYVSKADYPLRERERQRERKGTGTILDPWAR